MAVIAAISHETGLDLYQIQPFAATANIFQDYIAELSDRNRKEKLAIFMDNLAVHKTKEVRAECSSRDISLIYNVPYSPDFNPIETVFSKVKNHYKRIKIQA